MVIDATIGLGEAIGSGMVEPDHFVVDDGTERVISRSLGAKESSVRGLPGGRTAAHAVLLRRLAGHARPVHSART
jgi:pyruvate,water dikinase